MSVRSVSLVLMAAVAVLGFADTSQAAPKVAGPAIDFKGDYVNIPNGDVNTSSQWQTIWGSPRQGPNSGAPATIYAYPPGSADLGYGYVINTFNDNISVGNGDDLGGSTARYGAGAAYISYDDEALPTDSMIMTTIYGHDLDPFTPGALLLGGYDTSGLVVYPLLSDENIIGPSGTVYAASAGQLVPIVDLPALLPDADLSIFSGDRSLSVWVFQTEMPFGETAIPEPATAVLLLGTAIMAGVVVRRRR